MSSFLENTNIVTFVGRVAEDFEARTSQSGSSWGKLKITVEVQKGKDSEPVDVPVEITAFAHMANSLAVHVKPGMTVICSCQLRPSTFESKAGQTYAKLELSLVSYGIIPTKQAAAKGKSKKERDEVEDENIPF